jgi:CRISPR/Cas system CMR subunit Cmr6 (Cas7 group RAMP superfamily)
MSNDYWSEEARHQGTRFANTIRTFSGKSSERGAWMEHNLTPILRDAGHGRRFLRPIEQATLLYHLFAAEERETGSAAWKDDVRGAYKGLVFPPLEVPDEAQRLLNTLGLEADTVRLSALPAYSFVIRFTFRLEKPYLSRDDTPFYVVDNPVRKEKVLKLPITMPSQWKGALRAAMSYELAKWWLGLGDEEQAQRTNYRQFIAQRAAMTKMLGNEKGVLVSDDGFDAYLDHVGGDRLARIYRRFLRRFVTSTSFRAGRLRFFPTFFNQIGLEVINPHERSTRAGTQPIYIESVPQDAEGTFTVLYVPFDLVGKPTASVAQEVAGHLRILSTGVQAMMVTYGFGAKTSSGFGLVANDVTGGDLKIRLEGRSIPLPFGSLSELMVLANAVAKRIEPGGAQ